MEKTKNTSLAQIVKLYKAIKHISWYSWLKYHQHRAEMSGNLYFRPARKMKTNNMMKMF